MNALERDLVVECWRGVVDFFIGLEIDPLWAFWKVEIPAIFLQQN